MNKKTGIFLNNRQKNANYDTVLSKKCTYMLHMSKKNCTFAAAKV